MYREREREEYRERDISPSVLPIYIYIYIYIRPTPTTPGIAAINHNLTFTAIPQITASLIMVLGFDTLWGRQVFIPRS